MLKGGCGCGRVWRYLNRKNGFMAQVKTPAELGTEKVVWDLTAFYPAPDSAEVQADVEKLVGMLAEFERAFKGKLDTKLGQALAAQCAFTELYYHIIGYFQAASALDSVDPKLQQVRSRVQETLSMAMGQHVTFFDLEVGRMAEEAFEAQQSDDVVRHHLPMLRQIRRLAKYHLDEKVETMLTLRAPYGSAEWSDMMDELETQLRFDWDGKTLKLEEILHVVTEDADPERRAKALAVVNEGLQAQRYPYFFARTLNAIAGEGLLNDKTRGFTHPMEATNLGNMVDDATVDALHEVVERKGGELARRFYKLKARLLGLPTLRWSDRNARMPFADESVVSWEDACVTVRKAYHDFSPTLGALVDEVLDMGWVDAPPAPAKSGGAFDLTLPLPGKIESYVLLNYLGTKRDVSTLAHELGHAVHGKLAAQAQGPLMWYAPLPYAETASIFGEMLVFESLLAETHDKRARLALYMEKINEFLNSVVRQTSFSAFEKDLHGRRGNGKLAAGDMDGIWMDVTRRFYGADGEVFTYENTAHLWSYVSHFARPFYVYAYAFGELFTQSLMATRGDLGARFEPLYLELLRAGATKSAVELMAPFGLNPNEASFWERGMEASLGVWLTEAERLVSELEL